MKKPKPNTSKIDNPATSRDGVVLAVVTGAHGVRGLVRLKLFAQDETLIAHASNPTITLKNRHKGDIWLAAIDGITDKDQADAMRGHEVIIPRDLLPEPADDEVYFADMIDCAVHDCDGTPIGTVIAVENFGAGDLLEIKPNQGDSFYLSYTKSNIHSVDTNAKLITASIPDMV